MANGTTIAARVMAMPESITENYPTRPGLPGAPEPSAESIRAWILGIRDALLKAAENTLASAAYVIALNSDVHAANDLKEEAREFLALATEIGDMCGLDPRG